MAKSSSVVVGFSETMRFGGAPTTSVSPKSSVTAVRVGAASRAQPVATGERCDDDARERAGG